MHRAYGAALPPPTAAAAHIGIKLLKHFCQRLEICGGIPPLQARPAPQPQQAPPLLVCTCGRRRGERVREGDEADPICTLAGARAAKLQTAWACSPDPRAQRTAGLPAAGDACQPLLQRLGQLRDVQLRGFALCCCWGSDGRAVGGGGVERRHVKHRWRAALRAVASSRIHSGDPVPARQGDARGWHRPCTANSGRHSAGGRVRKGGAVWRCEAPSAVNHGSCGGTVLVGCWVKHGGRLPVS